MIIVSGVSICGDATAAPAGADLAQSTAQVNRLLADADSALKSGNQNLALIDLKNAAQLAPSNGEIRGRLGVLLLQTGQAVAAERELRQARNDYGPDELIIPALLRAMLERNEITELLTEFPDPQRGSLDRTSPDVLSARALALQLSGQPKQARAAMDRSLALRRDADGLAASARLAQRQADLVLARTQTDEALKLAPDHEQALLLSVLLTAQSGDARLALNKAEEFVRRLPENIVAQGLRISLLLQLNQDATAKQHVDAILKQKPDSIVGRFYRGVLLARSKDFGGAWRQLQNLPVEFLQSRADIMTTAAGIAAISGNAAIAIEMLTAFVTHNPDDQVPRVQLAAIRLDQNQPKEALDVLAPLSNSNDPAVHAVLAQAYIRLQRFNDAIASLQIAASAPNASKLLKHQLALEEINAGHTEDAVQQLRALVKSDPGNSAIIAPLVSALMAEKKWDEALVVAANFAKEAPNTALPEFYRGQILSARGDFPGAAAAFTKALQYDPKFVPALYYRADSWLARGNLTEARKDLQLLLSQNIANSLAYIRLTEIDLQTGDEAGALALLDRAIKAAPKDAAPRLALVNYDMNRGKYAQAQTAVDAVLQVAPKNPEGVALRGQLQLQRGEYDAAIKTFSGLVADNPTTAAAQVLLAKALYASKRNAAAEQAATKAVELDPHSAQTHMYLIDIQRSNGKPDLALATAHEFAAANPGAEGTLVVAETLVRLNRAKEAETLLDKSFAAAPDPRLALRLSQIAESVGDFAKSRAVLTALLQANPNDFALRREFAGMLLTSGDTAAARTQFEQLLKQRPDDPFILNDLGWLLQKDDPARALSLVSRAANIAPQSAEVTDTLGWIKYQRRDQQGALPILQRAHDLSPNNPSVSYHLAVVLAATGKKAEAKALLQATLAKNPKFDGADDAKQLLARW